MSERLKAIDDRLERIEGKLDSVVQSATAIHFLKWIMGATWVAIASLFAYSGPHK